MKWNISISLQNKSFYINKMNIRHTFVAFVSLLATTQIFSQNNVNKQLEAQRRQTLVALVNYAGTQFHYNPKKLDDRFSQELFNSYLEYVDYAKRFFLKGDIEYLSQYKFVLDEMIRNRRSYKFYNEVYTIYKKREDSVGKIIHEILTKPFDFNKEEKLNTDYEHVGYVDDFDELRSRWRKYLKYSAISKFYELRETNQKAVADSKTPSKKKSTKTKLVKAKSYTELEKESREFIKKNIKRWFKRLSGQKEKDWFNEFLNQIAEQYDPHTNYFGPRNQSNFNQSMSGQLEGIGARLTEKDGYIEIVEVLVGSPAWKQGDLSVGDKITDVRQGNKKKSVHVVNMPLEDAIELIKGKKGTKVVLTVKKMDGIVAEIPIVRDVIEIEETFVKSAVINHKGKKFGMINLPKFYVNLDKSKKNARDCSDDVRSEILKLKDENIEGIIVDLRDNGGGALNEAVQIVGHFIPNGPVVQVKEPGKRASVYEDEEKEVVWTGPLVVMVNEFTASASEIFSAAIQDYNRGIVIGSQRTFGKGTVQTVIDLDSRVSEQMTPFKPLGAVKLTIQKFYRINGGSTQIKGVTPDIILPTKYAFSDVGEKSYDGALEWDKIEPASYSEWKNLSVSSTLKNKIKLNSDKRIAKNKFFALVKENAEWLRKRKEEHDIDISLSDYEKEEKRIKKENEKYKPIKDMKTELNVSVLKVEKKKFKDKVYKEKKQAWMKKLGKDFYLQEAIFVIEEL